MAYFDCTGSLGFSVRVSYDTQPGKLVITGVQVAGSVYYGNVYYLTAELSAGEETLLSCNSYYGSHNVYLPAANTFTDIAAPDGGSLPPWTVEGQDKITVRLSFSGATADGNSGHGWHVTGSQTIALPQTQQAAAITAPASAALGDTLTVSIPGSGSKTVSWQLGSGTGVLGTTQAEHMAWTLPDSLAVYMAAQGEMLVLTCQSQGGTAQASVALSIPRRKPFLPELEVTLRPEGTALPVYIRGLSRVRGRLTATSVYGSIASLSMEVEGVSYPGAEPLSALLAGSGELAVLCRAVDGWGLETQVIQKITAAPYEAPRPVPYGNGNGVFCARCRSDGSPSAVGTGILLEAGLKLWDLDGQNSGGLELRIRPAGGSWGAWQTLLTASGSIRRVLENAAPSLLSSYQLQLRAWDSLGSSRDLTLTVPTAAAAFHLKKGGLGAAFGKFAEFDRVLEIAPDWDLFLKGSPVADHIAAAGENEAWHWRVYRSGFALCFGRVTGTAAYPVTFAQVPAVLAGSAVTATKEGCAVEGTAPVLVWGVT